MNKFLKPSSDWKQISIEDPLGLPGASICNVIKIIATLLDIKYVLLSDLSGPGTIIFENKLGSNTQVIEINDFLKKVVDVVQFDWGNFFLFKIYPEKWKTYVISKYEDAIIQTDTTVRAIDDTYIYIYTPYDEVVSLIEKKYSIETLKAGQPKDLDFPS